MSSDWQGYIFSIRDRNKELLKRNFWTDVSFAVFTDDTKSATRIFNAHKATLASASKVFEKMFSGSLAEDTSRDIPIGDVTADIFAAMLEYIYTDATDLNSWQSARNLYYAAKKYKLHALAQHCAECFSKFLLPENALEVYEIAALHDLPNLLEAALKVIQSKTCDVIKSPFFNEINLKTLMVIVGQDTLQTKEFELFNAVEALSLQRGAIKRKERFPKIDNAELYDPVLWKEFREVIKQIRFLSMTDEEFKDGPGFSSLITSAEALNISVCLTKLDKTEKLYPREFIQSKRVSAPKAPKL